MNYNIENTQVVCRPNDVANGTLNQDYIHIPGGVMNGTTPREFYCDSLLNATSVTCKFTIIKFINILKV